MLFSQWHRWILLVYSAPPLNRSTCLRKLKNESFSFFFSPPEPLRDFYLQDLQQFYQNLMDVHVIHTEERLGNAHQFISPFFPSLFSFSTRCIWTCVFFLLSGYGGRNDRIWWACCVGMRWTTCSVAEKHLFDDTVVDAEDDLALPVEACTKVSCLLRIFRSYCCCAKKSKNERNYVLLGWYTQQFC